MDLNWQTEVPEEIQPDPDENLSIQGRYVVDTLNKIISKAESIKGMARILDANQYFNGGGNNVTSEIIEVENLLNQISDEVSYSADVYQTVEDQPVDNTPEQDDLEDDEVMLYGDIEFV